MEENRETLNAYISELLAKMDTETLREVYRCIASIYINAGQNTA